MSIKKHLPTIIIFTIIIGVIALGIWYSDRNSPINELAKLNVYSKEELRFLEEEGFLNNIDSENLPSNKEQIISLLKSSNLIEQNLNSPDESFEVLATKLDENTYQLAFKLENKSNQSKVFYLIPVSESSQTEFKEIKGIVKSGKVNLASQGDWGYDIEKHKQELRPELAKAYDDIDNNGYTGKPIKLVLEANSTLLAQSKWEINRGLASDKLEPVYLLVYGSSGGMRDDLDKDKSFEQLDKVEKIKEDHYKIKYDKYSEVEIGNLETDDFEPTAKLKKWGDETYIKVSYPTTKKIKPKQEDKKLKWKDDKVEIHFYPLEPIEFEENGHTVKQLDEGGFEFEIILKEKPTTNKIVLNIETKGLKFYYQPELTQKEIEMGAFRPENVVGSYAVYHATKGNMHPSQEEAEKYKAGKAFHIYRPKITDANGNWAWESQVIDVEKGKITITIPQDFLDNAVYPLSSKGETFGFEGIGDSTYEYGDYMMGSVHQSGVAGTATSMSFYSNLNLSHTWRPVLYKDSDNSRVDYGAEHVHSADPGWETENLTQSGSIEASTDYKLGVWLKGTVLRVDAGAMGFYASDTYHATEIPPNPLVSDDWADQKFSIYATYTPGAANNAPTISSVTDYPDSLEVGTDITFSVDWNDADAEGIKMLICKSDAITAVTPSCDGGEWCSNKNDYDSTDPITCSYTTQSEDVGSNDYYAFVCDDDDECSASDSSTFTVGVAGLKRGLVSHWKLDDNLDTGVVLDAHGDNDGTVVNDEDNYSSDQSTETAKIVRAFDFDGTNDYVNVPHSAILNPLSYTIAFWFNPDTVTVNNFLLMKGNSDGDVDCGYRFYITSSGNLAFKTGKWDAGFSVSGGALVVGNWYHIVGTYDSVAQLMKLYVNGIYKNSDSSNFTNSNNDPLTFGRWMTPSYYGDGKMDEVTIWNRALDQDEITALYNGGDGWAYPFSFSVGIKGGFRVRGGLKIKF